MCGFRYCYLIAGIKSLSRHWCRLETAVTHAALLFYTHNQCPFFLLIIGSLLALSVTRGNTGIVKHLISWNDRVHVKRGGGRASPINSLAWQRCGEMIVGNFPTRQCVECVGEWGALNGKRSVEVVHTCVSVCETVRCPPAQLCWKAASVWSSQLGLFYPACWSCVNSLRGYRPAWHGGVCAGLPAARWTRGQQVDVIGCREWWQQKRF